MTYIGSTPTTQSFIAGTDYFNGDGSTVAFTLSRTVVSVNDIEVVINNVEQQPNTAYTVSGTTITFTSAPSSGTSNIYVRYLSTTTQSITPSQNTVSYSTLNSDTQSKLGISFKNRIINGDFRVSQYNGTSSTTPSSDVYVIDRFRPATSQASKLTWQQNKGSVTPPVGYTYYLGAAVSTTATVGAGDLFGLVQQIEGLNVADLNWGTANAKTITLSFQVYSSETGTFGGTVNAAANGYSYLFSYSIPAANTWTPVSITITGPTAGTWSTNNTASIQVFWGFGVGSTYGTGTAGVWTASTLLAPTGSKNIMGTSGATFYITGIQFEVGTQATTFDYRDYGRELILCQRYYETSNTVSGIGLKGVVCSCYSSTAAYSNFKYLVQKRAQPSVTALSAGNWNLYSSNAGLTISAVTPQNIDTNCFQIWVSGSGYTAGYAAHLDGQAVNMFTISAEL